MKHIIQTSCAALAAGVIAAGCSTSPPQSDVLAANTAIGNANHAVDSAAKDPHVAKYASSELDRARQSLHKAELSWKDDHDLETTKHLAYLAQQRAATAQELASERASHDAVVVAAAERDHALAVARENSQRAGATVTTGEGQVALAGFATGKAQLPASLGPKLDELASTLKSHPDRMVVIEGHTDSTGSPGYNKTLAMERAQAVRVALYRRGIDPGRVIVRSSGEDNPVASNDTKAGRRENRRAEVMLAEPAQAAPGASAMGQGGQAGQTASGQEEQGRQHHEHMQGQQNQDQQQNRQDEQDEHDHQDDENGNGRP